MSDEVDADQSILCRQVLPKLNVLARARQFVRPKDHKNRLVSDADVTWIMKGIKEGIKMPLVVGGSGIGLLHQNTVGGAMPNARPGLVGPAQAKGKIGFLEAEDLIKRTLDEP